MVYPIHAHPPTACPPAEMTHYNLMQHLNLLQQMAQQRIRERHKHETNHWTLLAQLTRFGVCPCVAMGRYSTCCGSRAVGGQEPEDS